MNAQNIHRRKSGVDGPAGSSGISPLFPVIRPGTESVVKIHPVEQQRKRAVAVAGKHVAEELIVSPDLPSGVGCVRLRIDHDMRARPELVPAGLLVLRGGGEGAWIEQGPGLGRPVLRIAVLLCAQGHREKVGFRRCRLEAPRPACPVLPMDRFIADRHEGVRRDQGPAENEPFRGIVDMAARPGLEREIFVPFGRILPVVVPPKQSICCWLNVIFSHIMGAVADIHRNFQMKLLSIAIPPGGEAHFQRPAAGGFKNKCRRGKPENSLEWAAVGG